MFISHEMDLAGHFAARSSLVRAKTMFYSPTLNRDLTNLVAVCALCSLSQETEVSEYQEQCPSFPGGWVCRALCEL